MIEWSVKILKLTKWFANPDSINNENTSHAAKGFEQQQPGINLYDSCGVLNSKISNNKGREIPTHFSNRLEVRTNL